MTISNALELERVFMLTWDTYSGIDPVTIEQETDGQINPRFARELLGVLTSKDFLYLGEVGGEDVWAVNDNELSIAWAPENRDEAHEMIRSWIGLKDATTKAKAPRAKREKTNAEVHPCYCGCEGETSNFYMPGHDARHASMVGKAAAQAIIKTTKAGAVPTLNIKVDRDRFTDLPSDRLVEKAQRICETALAKHNSKKINQPKPVDGHITWRKKACPARRLPDGTVEWKKIQSDPEWTTASATAAKTFKESK